MVEKRNKTVFVIIIILVILIGIIIGLMIMGPVDETDRAHAKNVDGNTVVDVNQLIDINSNLVVNSDVNDVNN